MTTIKSNNDGLLALLIEVVLQSFQQEEIHSFFLTSDVSAPPMVVFLCSTHLGLNYLQEKMYAEGDLFFPYLEGLGLSVFEETQLQLQDELLRNLRLDGIHDDNGILIDDDCHSHLYIGSDSMRNLMLSSSSSENGIYEEGYLFKAPESIIEEQPSTVTSSSITMMSTGEAVILPVSDTEKLEEEHHLFLDLLDTYFFSEIPNLESQESPAVNDPVREEDGCSVMEVPIQKSLSVDTNEWIKGLPTKQSFSDLHEIDAGNELGIRRAYSEGDIKTLRHAGLDFSYPSIIQLQHFDRVLTKEWQKIEERKQKLSRYMEKKMKRNFGRKIKYACRKALADNQPRVRGRFAKPEECEIMKPTM